MTNKVDYEPIKYSCNGITEDFSFDFKINDVNELLVYLEDKTTTKQIKQNIGSDYTVNIKAVGGSIHFLTAPTDNCTVILVRETPRYQGSTFSTSPGFQGSEIEKSYDKISCALQEVDYELKRCLKTPVGTNDIDLTLPTPKAGKVMMWNDEETGLTNSETSIDEVDGLVAQAKTSAETAIKKADIATEKADLIAKSAEEVKTSADNAISEINKLSKTTMDNIEIACNDHLGDNFIGQIVRSNVPLYEETLARCGSRLGTDTEFYNYMYDLKDKTTIKTVYHELKLDSKVSYGDVDEYYYTTSTPVEDVYYNLGKHIPYQNYLYTYNIDKMCSITNGELFTAFKYTLEHSIGSDAPEAILIFPDNKQHKGLYGNPTEFKEYTGGEVVPDKNYVFYRYDNDEKLLTAIDGIDDVAYKQVLNPSRLVLRVIDDEQNMNEYYYNCNPDEIVFVAEYNNKMYYSDVRLTGEQFEFKENSIFQTTKEYRSDLLKNSERAKYYLPAKTIYDEVKNNINGKLQDNKCDDSDNVYFYTSDINEQIYFDEGSCNIDKYYRLSDLTDGKNITFGSLIDGVKKDSPYNTKDLIGRQLSITVNTPNEWVANSDLYFSYRAFILRITDVAGSINCYMAGYNSSGVKWRYSNVSTGIKLENNCRYRIWLCHYTSENVLLCKNLFTGAIQKYTFANAIYSAYNYCNNIGLQTIYHADAAVPSGANYELARFELGQHRLFAEFYQNVIYEQGIYLPNYAQTDLDKNIYSYVVIANGIADGKVLKNYVKEVENLIESSEIKNCLDANLSKITNVGAMSIMDMIAPNYDAGTTVMISNSEDKPTIISKSGWLSMYYGIGDNATLIFGEKQTYRYQKQTIHNHYADSLIYVGKGTKVYSTSTSVTLQFYPCRGVTQ